MTFSNLTGSASRKPRLVGGVEGRIEKNTSLPGSLALWAGSFTFFLIAIFSLHMPVAVGAEPSDLYFIDAHSQADSEQVLQKVIPLMDQAGVRHTLLSARDNLTSGDIAKFAEQHPERITASVRTKGRAYQQNSAGYYKTIERDVGSGRFGAITELLMYHAQKGQRAPEVAVYPNDNRVQSALTLVKKKKWPLVVHIEFASLSEGEKIKYMEQLEAMLSQNADHPFMMIHMGQLRSGDVQRLIEAHKNLYFITSHANPVVISKSKQPWTQMFDGDVLARDWKELLVKYPDRFVFALDNVWPEHWGNTICSRSSTGGRHSTLFLVRSPMRLRTKMPSAYGRSPRSKRWYPRVSGSA